LSIWSRNYNTIRYRSAREMTRPYKKKNKARSSSKKNENEQEYTEEQIQQMVNGILSCNYFPQDITQSDMEDYLRKEESGEAVFTSLESVERAQKAIELKRNEHIDEITRRFNKNYEEHGIEPTIEDQVNANEEVRLNTIKQYADMTKELKAKFQVDRQRIINTVKSGKMESGEYTDKQIVDFVASTWILKMTIDGMETKLKDWEVEVKERFGHDWRK
jgi:hypothetical protein